MTVLYSAPLHEPPVVNFPPKIEAASPVVRLRFVLILRKEVVVPKLSTINRYAHRAKSILNSVKRNEDVNERVIRELKEEIEKLRQQLLREGGGAAAGARMTGEDAAGLQVRLYRCPIQ